MKKIRFSVILFVLAAMALSACTAGTAAAPTPGGTASNVTPAATDSSATMPAATAVGTAEIPNTAGTPSTGTGTAAAPEVTGTTTPGGSGIPAGAPIATLLPPTDGTSAATVYPTIMPTSGSTAQSTPTEGTASASTPAVETPAAVNTPSAGTPAATASGSTGGTTAAANLVRLSELMKSTVNTSDNASIGKIDGILVEHPALPTAASGATPTPAASGAPAGLFVRYVVVYAPTSASTGSSSTSRGNDVVIPWQAFNFASNTAMGSTVTANIASSALATAPRVGLSDIASGSTAWNAPSASFWSSQGVSIPATGAPAAGMVMTLIPSNMRNISIADATDTVLGPIADFLIDPTTGEVMYAVFNGGAAFNNRTFVIPMANLTWNATTPVGGNFNFNFDLNALKNAPFVNSLQEFLNGQGINSQFWNTLPTAVPPAPTAAP